MKKLIKGGLLVMISLVAFFIFVTIKSSSNNIKSKNIDIRDNLDIITGREILNVDGIVYIGNNKKEIEGGFYDIKIEYDLKKLKLYINSLSKEKDKERFNTEYCLEVCKYTGLLFENNIDVQKLCTNLSDSYNKLRQNYIIDGLGPVNYSDGKFNVSLYESGNELCLEILK